jgi:hypothetical protein
MTRRFGNCEYQFSTPKGKPVFVPSTEGRRIGSILKSKIEELFDPPRHFYHLARGGHISAIHAHRNNAFYARLDLENFFYSIGRNRVTRSLRNLGLERAPYYSKWSTIKNPFGQPSYSVPYGFIQSPIIASLVLADSKIGKLIKEAGKFVTVSVYVDDIAISGNDLNDLQAIYEELEGAIIDSGFIISQAKRSAPANLVELFNCNIKRHQSKVTENRKNLYYSEPRTARSMFAFDAYCEAVSHGNGTSENLAIDATS